MVDVASQVSEGLWGRNYSPYHLTLTPCGHSNRWVICGSVGACSSWYWVVLLEVVQHAFADEVAGDLRRVDVAGCVLEVALAKVTTKSVRIGKYSAIDIET